MQQWCIKACGTWLLSAIFSVTPVAGKQITNPEEKIKSWNIIGKTIEFIAATNGSPLYLLSSDVTKESSTPWEQIDQSTRGLLQDTGHEKHPSPLELSTETVRLYRLTSLPLSRCSITNRNPEPLFAFKQIALEPGENWISLWGTPPNDRVSALFGHSLPAGRNPQEATRITWSIQEHKKSYLYEIWLKEDEQGKQWQGLSTLHGSVEDFEFPYLQGFMIHLPPGTPPLKRPFIFRVHRETTPPKRPSGTKFTLVGLHTPRWSSPETAGLLQGGFTGGPTPVHSTSFGNITEKNNKTALSSGSASTDATWRLASKGFPPAPHDYFSPDDAFIIHTRNLENIAP